jgi:hypothetical protein
LIFTWDPRSKPICYDFKKINYMHKRNEGVEEPSKLDVSYER